jgi:archaemetzincin
MTVSRIALALLLATTASCGAADKPQRNMDLPEKYQRLLPLHTPLAKPQPRDWLAQHREPGQSYAEYLAGKPVRATKPRGVLYIQPPGDFDAAQRKILDQTAEFMGIYFQLPVKVTEDLPLKVIPEKARRKHPTWGMDQILSTYVLDDVLRPRLPKDACAYLALTASDLWPGEGWNFVFGQASLSERVGVWSIYRNGELNAGEEARRLCLLRTIKTATHETGHMFSMQHCTFYECNMCGSNHREESDGKPMWLCPHCLAKLCHATGADPVKRFKDLIAFCKAQGLTKEQQFYERSLAVLTGEAASPDKATR